MGYQVGLDCVLGYKVGGYGESGDFLEADSIADLTGNFSHNEADATTRANQGWEATVPTLKVAEITGNVVYDTADPFFLALEEAWANREIMGIAMLDGPLESGRGWKFNCNVFNFTMNQPKDGVVTVDFSLKPTYSPTAPPVPVTGGVNEGEEPTAPED